MDILAKLKTVKWSDLRRCGTSSALTSSYVWLAIVPIAAKIALQLKQPFVVTFFGKTHTLYAHLPFSWCLFYFAAVAFAVASGLFAIFCPKMIKRYSSFAEFYGESSGARALLTYYWTLDTESRDEALPELYVEAGRAFEAAGRDIPRHPGNSAELSIVVQDMIRSVKREELTDLFSTLRFWHDRRSPKVRALTFGFYCVGFALITFVGLQNLFWVCRVLMQGTSL